MIDSVFAMLISFGLALIYFIGGLSIMGTPSLGISKFEENYSSVSLTMTILGLIAGYLLPLDILKKRLEHMLDEDNK